MLNRTSFYWDCSSPLPPHDLRTIACIRLNTMGGPKQFRIGVLMSGSVQLLDTSPVDLFGMMHTAYLKACNLPKPITDLGIEVQVLYISKASPFNECTANAALRVTHSPSSPDCAPGELDLLFIPGPDPSDVPDKDIKEFVKGHAEVQSTTVMSICTGIYVAGYSGILDQKSATGPRAFVPELKKKFPGAKWVEKRWEVDGNIWTSGETSSFFLL
jgi:transcriptional regulator GlxA family with amidase domain